MISRNTARLFESKLSTIVLPRLFFNIENGKLSPHGNIIVDETLFSNVTTQLKLQWVSEPNRTEPQNRDFIDR